MLEKKMEQKKGHFATASLGMYVLGMYVGSSTLEHYSSNTALKPEYQ